MTYAPILCPTCGKHRPPGSDPTKRCHVCAGKLAARSPKHIAAHEKHALWTKYGPVTQPAPLLGVWTSRRIPELADARRAALARKTKHAEG